MLGLLNAQSQPGLLNNMKPLVTMALGASLLSAGRGYGSGRFDMGGLLGALQSSQRMQAAQQQNALNNAFRQEQFDFQKRKFAQALAQQGAQLALARQRLGLDRDKFGLSRDQFGLLQKQYQDRINAIERLSQNVGVLGDETKGTEPSGLLGGKLTPQQFRLLNAPNFLAVGSPTGAIQMINKALPGQLEPTTLQRNLIAAGLKPNTPEYQSAVLKSITKPNTNVQLNMDKGLMRVDLKKIERYDKLSETAANNLAKINQFKQAISQFETGSLAPLKLQLSKLDQAAGGFITDAKTVGTGELIKTFGTEFMLQFIQRTKGAISERENKLFMGASPGLDKTPEGNLRIASAMEDVNQRLFEKASFMRNYLKKNNTLTGAEQAWGRYINENPILDKNFRINRKNIRNWKSYLSPNYSRQPEKEGAGYTSVFSSSQADPLGIR